MNGLALLALAHARYRAGRTLLLVACVAVSIFLPWAGARVVSRYEVGLLARAHATPLVLGLKGSRFDLALSALYFRSPRVEALRMGQLEQLSGEGLAIPLHVGSEARGYPLIGTTPEYYELRRLRCGAGALPAVIGDVVLGALVAEELAMGPGDQIYSDPRELYDISKPAALRMRVVGVLEPAGTVDDRALFIDIKTAWILDGLAHGHVDVGSSELDEALILGRDGPRVAVNLALMEDGEVSEQTLERFHFHGDPADRPITCAIFDPDSEKDGTIAASRINRTTALQLVSPTEVVEELMAQVLRVKRLFDVLGALLGLTTAALVTLVLALSTRLREGELRTLDRIGASRGVTLRLVLIEVLGIALLATTVAWAGVELAERLVPDPSRVL